MEARSAVSSTESEDSLLVCDSDIIDVVSGEMDIFDRAVSCSMQQTTEYDELVKLMTCARARLSLNFSGSMQDTAEGHLDAQVCSSKETSFSPRPAHLGVRCVETSILCPCGSAYSYLNVVGLSQQGNEWMPWVEWNLAN